MRCFVARVPDHFAEAGQLPQHIRQRAAEGGQFHPPAFRSVLRRRRPSPLDPGFDAVIWVYPPKGYRMIADLGNSLNGIEIIAAKLTKSRLAAIVPPAFLGGVE